MSEQTGSWQPDPFGRNQYRYWDGAQWTDQVSNDGVVSTDPAVADATTAAAADPVESTLSAGEPTPSAADPAGWGADTEPAPTAAVPTTPATYPAAGAPGGPTYGDSGPVVADGDGGGGSKLPLIIGGVGLLALILGVGAYFLFFSGDDDDVRGDLITEFRKAPFNLTSSQAECVVDELDDATDLEAMHRSIADGERATDSQTSAIVSALRDCDAPVPAALGGADVDDDDDTDDTTTTTDPDDDDDSGTGSGMDLPPAMLDMLSQQIAAQTGLDPNDARCVVEGLFANMSDENFGAILGGQELDIESMSWAVDVFNDCGVDPADINSGGSTTPSGGSSYGDDPALDALWDACAGGDGEACDELYFNSPFDSEYEEFGDTCGDRFEAGTVYCAEVM